MIRKNDFSLKRIIVMAICAVLGCFVLAVGIMLPAWHDDYAFADITQSAVIDNSAGGGTLANREYASVKVASVYGDRQPVYYSDFYNSDDNIENFKKNLIVTGTIADDETEYILEPGEYSVAFAVSDDGTVATATITAVKGGATAALENLAVKKAADITAIEISVPSDLTDDYTLALLANEISVKSGEDTLNRDLYTLKFTDDEENELSDILTGKTTVKLTATLVSNSEIAKSVTVALTAAKLNEIAVEVAPEYTLNNDGYYADSDGNHAFAAEMPAATVLKRLIITAVYPNSSHVIAFNSDGVPTTGEQSVMLNPQALAVGNNTVTVQVVGLSGTASANLEIKANAREIVGIKAEYIGDKTPGILKVYDSIGVSNVAVYPIFNNGLTDTATLDNDLYKIEGSLLPEDFSNTSGYYGKTLNVRYLNKIERPGQDTVYTETTITCKLELPAIIQYVQPKEVRGLGGSVATQTARSEFNPAGITVTLRYNTDVEYEYNDIDVPLSDFLTDTYNLTYYDAATGGSELIEQKLSKKAKGVRIAFTYPQTLSGESAAIRRFAIANVLQVFTSIPDFGDVTPDGIEYIDGVNKVVKGIYETAIGDNPAMNFTVTPKPGSAVKITGDIDKTIEFIGAGTYEITVVLADGENGDFQWASPNRPDVVRSLDGYTLTYTLVITKGVFKVEIEFSGEAAFEYGGSMPTMTAKGTLGSGDYAKTYIFNDSGAAETINLPVAYKYYGWGDFTYDNPSNKAPITVGQNYYVYAVVGTESNSQYAVSKVTEADAQKFAVYPKTVALGNALKSQTYDRTKDYGVKDFIDISKFGSDWSDTNPPVELKDENNETTLKYAGNHSVTLTITNPNYVWTAVNHTAWTDAELKAAQEANTTLTINKRGTDITISGANGWVYGTSGVTLSTTAIPNDSAHFYAAVSGPKYYLKNADGSKGAEQTEPNLSKWDAGTYIIEYITSWNGTDPKEEASVEVGAFTSEITVNKARVKKIGISDRTETYNGTTGHDFVFVNWGEELLNGGLMDGVTLNTLLSRRISGVRFGDGGAAIDYTDNVNLAAINLTEAGIYTVMVLLPDGGKNYEWDDGTVSDVEAAWIINKAPVAQIKAPDAAAYNGTQQTLVLKGTWDSSVISVKNVTGTKIGDESSVLQGIDFTATDGTVKLKFAGNYIITVSLENEDNYEWIKELGQTDNFSTPLELAYTLNQATITFDNNDISQDFDDGKTNQFEFVIFGDNKYVALKPTGIAATDGLLLYAEVYDNEQCTGSPIISVTEAKTYYLKLAAFDGAFEYNYKLPEGLENLRVTAVINSKGLDAPVLTMNGQSDGESVTEYTISVMYKAAEFDIRAFIVDWQTKYNTKFGQTGNVEKLEFAYYSGETLVSTMRNVGTYTVYIYPNGNYSWNLEQPGVNAGTENGISNFIKYTFTVTQYELNLEWTDKEVIFDEAFRTVAYVPTVSLGVLPDGNGDGENITVIAATTIGGTSAGDSHVATATLDGSAKGNYTIESGANCTFTIYKQVLTAPVKNLTAEQQKGLRFTGASQNVAFTADWSNWSAINGGLVTADVTAENGLVNLATGDRTEEGSSFAVSNGTFAFINAGKYSLTFTITDIVNYCWSADAKDDFTQVKNYTTDANVITVARMEIEAPALGEKRAIPLAGAEEVRPFEGIAGAQDGVNYSIAYGNVTGSAGSWSYEGTITGAVGRGVYFAKLRFTDNAIAGSDNFGIYNYMWKFNTEDSKSTASGMAYVGEYGMVSPDGLDIYLQWAITRTQLDSFVSFSFDNVGGVESGYVFGDNGYAEIGSPAAWFKLDAANVTANDLLSADNARLLKMTAESGFIMEGLNPEIILTFTKEDDESAAVELVNGLPWNAGTYKVNVLVKFNDNNNDAETTRAGIAEDFQNFSKTLTLNVAQRIVEVDWYGAESGIYNGSEQIRAAKVANLPKKSEDDTPADIELKVELDSAKEGTGGKPVNVKTNADGNVVAYNVKVADFAEGATGAANYKVDGATTLESTYTINKRTVKISPEILSDHIYGEVIGNTSTPTKFWRYTDSADESTHFCGADGGDSGVLSVNLVKDGFVVASAYPNVGEYSVKFALKNGVNNYELVAAADGVIAIVEREIIVTVSNASSKYGEALSTITTSEALVDTSLSGNAIINGDSVYSVKAKVAANGTEITSVSTVISGGYVIYINQINANYKIKIAGQDGFLTLNTDTDTGSKYTLENADITNITSPVYGGAGGATYDAEEHTLLLSDKSAEVKNPKSDGNPNGMEAVWSVATVDSESADKPALDAGSEVWQPFDSVKVKDAGTYYFYVRVSALNHNSEYASDAPITVIIKQKEVTVKIDLSIFYGETKPESVIIDGRTGYKMSVADLQNAENKNTVFTLTGLEGIDTEVFYNGGITLGGAFTYETDYSVGKAANADSQGEFLTGETGYDITFKPATLSATNYKFINETGKLKVKRVALEVTLNNLEAVYNTKADGEPKAAADSYATHEVISSATYAGTTLEVESADLASIYTLKSQAIDTKFEVKGGVYATTNRAGNYSIYAVAAVGGKSADYEIKFIGSSAESAEKPAGAYGTYAGNAVYKITLADFVKADVQKYYNYTDNANAKYDENEHDSLAFKKDGVGVEKPADSVDGSDITIRYYYRYLTEGSIDISNLKFSDVQATDSEWTFNNTIVPQVKNAGTYYVCYNLNDRNVNHNDLFMAFEIVVEKGNNDFTVDFAFADATVYVEFGGFLTENAWVYGKKTADNPFGYDKESRHAVTEPKTSFSENESGGNNSLTVMLSRYDGTNWIDCSAADYTSTSAELIAAQFATGYFKAGSYKLTFNMAGCGGNYDAISKDYYFGVGRKELTVTPGVAETVIYGEEAQYTFELSGFATNNDGEAAETIEDVLSGKDIASADLIWDYSGTQYQSGDNVGTYTIVVKDNGYQKYFDNYTLKFTEGVTFTLEQRKVTITIDDKSNHYKFLGEYDNNTEYYDIEPARELTFSLAADSKSFFDGDIIAAPVDGAAWSNDNIKVFKLYTSAIIGSGDTLATADAGEYAIYAVFENKETVNYGTNYVIGFSGCRYIPNVDSGRAELPENAIKQNGENSAGIYKIEKAKLYFEAERLPYHITASGEEERYTAATANIYDGDEKFYKAELKGRNLEGVNIKFSDKYQILNADGSWSTISYRPKNVGTYRVYFEVTGVDGNNYEDLDTTQRTSFPINPRSITLSTEGTAYSAESEFNREEKEVKYIFSNVIASDTLDLSVTVTPKELDGSATNRLLTPTVTYPSAGDNRGTLSFKIRNAGIYETSIALKSTDAMANYVIVHNSADVDTLTPVYKITLAPLTVTVNSRNIEYGNTIDNNSFTVHYGISGAENDGTHFITAGLKFTTSGTTAGVEGDAYSAEPYEKDGTNKPASPAGSKFTVSASGIIAYNYNLIYVDGTLDVIQRQIEIAVLGSDKNQYAKHEYTGQNKDLHTVYLNNSISVSDINNRRNEFFKVDPNSAFAKTGDTLDMFAIQLAFAGDSANVGTYKFKVDSGRSYGNYYVTFKLSDGTELTDVNLPSYEITKKTLTVKAGFANPDATFDTLVTAVNATYGDILLSDDERSVLNVTVRYNGFIQGEGSATGGWSLSDTNFKGEIKFKLTNNQSGTGTVYEAYKSHAGEAYYALPYGLDFENYDVKYEYATVTVISRKVTLSAKDMEYTADTDYHGGAYGISHDAPIVFAGVGNAPAGFEPKPSVTYSTVANAAYGQTGKAAPTRAGEYSVYIEFKPVNGFYDYVFDTNMQNKDAKTKTVTAQKLDYEFNVTKKQIELKWTRNTIDNNNPDEKNNAISAFIKDIMNIPSFTRADGSGGEGYSLKADTDYTVSNSGLIQKMFMLGNYRITVELKSSATDNYTLNDGNTQVVLEFRVAGTGFVEINIVSMSGWKYGDAEKTPQTELLDRDSGQMVAGSIVDRYATVTKTDSNASALAGLLNKGEITEEEIASAFGSLTYSAQQPHNAGYYIYRASFAGNTVYNAANDVYYIFEIERAKIALPVVTVISEGNGKNDTFSGEELRAAVSGFDASIMRVVSATAQTEQNGNNVALIATNSGTYKITIGFANINYDWSDSKTAVNRELSWTVKPSETNAVTWNSDNDTSKDYGTAYRILAQGKYAPGVTYAYALRSENEKIENANSWSGNKNWQAGLPVDAGEYWIQAVSAATGNYNRAEGYFAFNINRVQLRVTASGGMTYGQTFANGYCSYAINTTDLKNNDTEAYIRNILDNGVTYNLVSAPAGKLDAGTYAVTAAGMSARNYDVVYESGDFVVSKASIAVSLGGNPSSLYSKDIDLSAVTIEVDGLKFGDKKELLGLENKLSTGATNTSDARTYSVTVAADWQHKNYVIVSITPGIYTVNKLPVSVTVDWGGYEYGTAPKLPSVIKALDGQYDVTEDVRRYISFTYASSAVAPVISGNHAVAATIAENCNYVLSESVSGVFVISPRELNADDIKWETVYYDGTVKAPKITENPFGAIFDIDYTGERINAGRQYAIVLTLKDNVNTKWATVDGAVRTVYFTIEQGENRLTEELKINGWVYGEYDAAVNSPSAKVAHGSVIEYAYSTSENGTYTTGAPVSGNAGDYWVRVIVPETTNYKRFESTPVKFKIDKAILQVPKLIIISEGYGKNDTYTGDAMRAAISGYESAVMRISYGGESMIVDGNNIQLVATNAGVYKATLSLINSQNYRWSNDAELDGEIAVLTWTIAKKKVGKPTANDSTYIVNGSNLTYYPIGYDADIMDIKGNTSGYGGSFTATVSLKDTDNYEWADGASGDITFNWKVVGGDTVFAAVAGTLGGLAGVAAIAVGIQVFLHYRKKRMEAGEAK